MKKSTYVCVCVCVCVKYMLNYFAVQQKCGEGNGTPLQYSCLENPMDGEAW